MGVTDMGGTDSGGGEERHGGRDGHEIQVSQQKLCYTFKCISAVLYILMKSLKNQIKPCNWF